MCIEQPGTSPQWLAPTIFSLVLLFSGVPVVAQAASEEAGHYTDIVTPNGRAD